MLLVLLAAVLDESEEGGECGFVALDERLAEAVGRLLTLSRVFEDGSHFAHDVFLFVEAFLPEAECLVFGSAADGALLEVGTHVALCNEAHGVAVLGVAIDVEERLTLCVSFKAERSVHHFNAVSVSCFDGSQISLRGFCVADAFNAKTLCQRGRERECSKCCQ